MASTFRIPKATITGLYGKALTTYARRSWGQVPDNAYVLWHNRKVMKAVFSFEQKVAKFDALDRDLSVLAQAATAATVGCSWCLDFGYYLAHSEGMDLEKIREVMRWRESDVFSPVEREVLGYAEAMSTTPLTVTDEMVASLIEHLGEAGGRRADDDGRDRERAGPLQLRGRPAGTGVLGRLRGPDAGPGVPARRTVES